MNRFELISERVGVLGKGLSTRDAYYRLRRSIDQIELGLDGIWGRGDDYGISMKNCLTEAMIYLLVLSSKQDHCGACLCGAMEEKIEKMEWGGVEGINMVVMPPTVVNQDNVPKGFVIVPEPEGSVLKEYISGTDPALGDSIIKISEKGAVDAFTCSECGGVFTSTSPVFRGRVLCAGCEEGIKNMER